eukprot:CCRYP_000803-RC/>CCRYP_000803-RC protein AED:0.13 eAED:0.13 QI:0/0.33/0/1/0.33/0/4/0/756
MPCPTFQQKAKHASFLGCDVLISSEWGQGMLSPQGGALASADRMALNHGDTVEEGSYDVAELVCACRPRYHLAPGPLVTVSNNDEEERRNKFVASFPYRYPPTTGGSNDGLGGHAGRFLALGCVSSPSVAKALGKPFKFIHAIGVVPLAHMNAEERMIAREAESVVDCPYTDASYHVDENLITTKTFTNAEWNGGGLSEARARRIAQEDMARTMSGGDAGGAFRWQQRPRKRMREDDTNNGREKAEEERQSIEENNPNNTSLFLHGLHRDPGGSLTMDVLMDAFRPFGCVNVRFPKARVNPMGGVNAPSYAFLDFKSHEEASQCLADLKGEVVIRNIMLTLKWSSSQSNPNILPPPPPPKRKNRLTEAEAADSTTLFLRLPPTIDSSAYPAELETLRLLAQRAMEDELNVGIPLDSPDRITAVDEPALRVTVRQPDAERNYGFLGFDSHTAALTTLISLTGNEDDGVVSGEKLAMIIGNVDGAIASSQGRDASHLEGVTLYWAKGGQPKTDGGENGGNHGLHFNKRHFPPDSRTDCWFCLASPTCEKHLIVAVYDECYVAMPKGAVNDFHALIVPVDHKQQGALVDRKLAPEIDDIKTKLRLHARQVLQKDLFVFERSIQTKGGYHTHVQCIPVDAGSGPSIQSKMLEMAVYAGFQLKEITSDLGLGALVDDFSGGYFYAEIPLPGGGHDFRRFIYHAGEGGNEKVNSGTVPLQFGREVLAAVMENPDIGQWKACVMSQEKESDLTIAFRKSLASV